MHCLRSLFGLGLVTLCLSGVMWGCVSGYQVGVGRADCTGPPVEIHFMGYANIKQVGRGLHLRQFARAFVVEDEPQASRLRFSRCGGTHTHGGPGGFLMHLLYDISILGFVPRPSRRSFRVATWLSIKRATDNMVDGKILTQLLVDLDNNLLGAFNWYAVHPTSMNNTNKLVTSDNMGYAAILLEKEYNTNKVPGKGKFVGAFCSSNLGDVSPNIMGPRCSISGNECDLLTSKCPQKEGECFASGPGRDMLRALRS
ncbi:unnamed protein product [Ceratitis capitata]|uniref:Neutral ceramidase n=1 Tax=Ceratitis capitata TaxID=7213 RepID=A0A811U1M7_CERCA|nr:unnamed protein product [Ceratitis capitata]